MLYVEYLNNLIKTEVIKPDHCVLFGQNINAGSCLTGLTRGLKVKPGSRIINSTNAENSLVGLGFGLMMNGASGVFFMKQMDFLLLGVDQLVNTYNIIRSIGHQPATGSFTIMATVVDSGYEGPQSALNNFADFCSIARVPGFTVTNKWDAERIIPGELIVPGFRIIGLSQRLSRIELLVPAEPLYISDDKTVFQYTDGQVATIVSFNFSFPQAWQLVQDLKNNNIQTSLFNVNSPVPIDWTKIVASARATQKLIVIDDSKSKNVAGDALVAGICGRADLKKKIVVKRQLGSDWLQPVSDEMLIDTNYVVNELLS